MVYKYFSGKLDILNAISDLENAKISSEIRQLIERDSRFEDKITACLVHATRIAETNTYVKEYIKALGLASQSVDPTSKTFENTRGYWFSFISRSLQNGDISKDLTVDDVISWLVLSQIMLLIKVDSVTLTNDELEGFVRRFIIEPILNRA